MTESSTDDRTRERHDGRGLKVLMVTPRYLPEIGGVERHVHEVATRIAASGEAAVTVLTTVRDGRLASLGRDGEVEIRRVAAHPRGRDWMFAPAIVPVIANGGWDVVHVQSYHTLVAPLAMAAAARRRIPYIVTFHGGGHSQRIRNQARRGQRALLRPLLVRAAALVALAPFEIDTYSAELRIGRERFVLIPNGVDLPAPAAADARNGTPVLAGPLIASVGRLERYKGHQRVIAAFAHVRAAEPQARLWIAGSGPYEAALRRQAADLGIADAVEISAVAAGDRAEMARRLSQVDLVVLLSDFETNPIAALETISLGRPLLVASGSGLGELADRGLARAIDPGIAPQQAAAAIMRELHDPLERPAVALPTWDDCAAGLLALYRRASGRPR
ncbi:MAG: glycosyltransferase family 4 protein [Solirubrobacteraceae bacterium]|jgi:glycosyltransferase involved in cell wall biosynthesis